MTPPARDEASEVAPFQDEDTDGAAAFERAARAAQALAELEPPPTEPSPAPSHTTPAPLELGRVVLLMAVVTGVWLAFMTVDLLFE